MKRLYAAAIVAAMSSVAVPAMAQSHQELAAQGGAASGAVTGATAGAIGGAIVGGPVGAVVGGVGGAVVGGATGGTVAAAITPEDRVYVRRYVDEREVAPVMTRQRIVVGRPLPRTVRTYRFEGNPRLTAYNYARVNNQYYLVDARGNVMGSID
jgi:uncharacterized protein YcfJ